MITDKNKVLKVLKAALVDAYYTRFSYCITAFECELFNDNLGISAYIVFSEVELENKIEWKKWIDSYPFNIDNCNGPEEPARAFLMGLLTQVSIQDVEEEKDGTLIVIFQNGMRIRLVGETEVEDTSWNIEFRNSDGERIGNCTCSFNEMFLTVSEELSKMLRLPHYS
ncbi:hypothetical protein MTX78_06635 [Hymenobacter tibetensis]|uniref:Uncharacterized protein n=1 Tax=Hymenobacter tibetensis TaxID=497967 RepID=A0ABY4D177_9BACT|nr:hypothetical protein [Hymenobacter tibetensis]UOG76270.1 hypothetical protein MTX78_06635 [Hymenobacter tibetensis]